MRVPASSSARTRRPSSRPKWMLWCAVPVGSAPRRRRATPTRRRRVATTPRDPWRLDPGEQRAVRDREIGVADDGVGAHDASAVQRTPLTRPRAPALEHDAFDACAYRNVGAGLLGRAPRARPARACMPPSGKNTPFDGVHVGDHGVQRERLERRESGVHAPGSRTPAAGARRRRSGRRCRPACRNAPRRTSRAPASSGRTEVERRVEVAVDEVRHLRPRTSA